jgi:hypothetical protein
MEDRRMAAAISPLGMASGAAAQKALTHSCATNTVMAATISLLGMPSGKAAQKALTHSCATTTVTATTISLPRGTIADTGVIMRAGAAIAATEATSSPVGTAIIDTTVTTAATGMATGAITLPVCTAITTTTVDITVDITNPRDGTTIAFNHRGK